MSFVNQIGLMLVDEIHILGDDRGPCLEAALCRMKTIRRIMAIKSPTAPAASLRIIGVSATIANIQDIATFLECHPENAFKFDETFRPVPLSTNVIGFPSRQGGSSFQFDSFLSYKVYEVIKAYANDKSVRLTIVDQCHDTLAIGCQKCFLMAMALFEAYVQVLIFCATRRMAIQSANQLVKTVVERNESYIVGGHQQKALATAGSKCKNQSLAELLRHGVGNCPKCLKALASNILHKFYCTCDTFFTRISLRRVRAFRSQHCGGIVHCKAHSGSVLHINFGSRSQPAFLFGHHQRYCYVRRSRQISRVLRNRPAANGRSSRSSAI